jgi:ribokinase
VKHSEFPYKIPKMTQPKWLYLSSLASNSLDYHMQIAEYVNKNPEVKLVFQPGTFQIKLGTEKLKGIYERTEIFFCNIEEAKIILNMSGGGKDKEEVRKLAEAMTNLGPKLVILTDGANGAYAYDAREGKSNLFFMRPYPDPKPPVDRTGAGDAFASTFTSAIILGKTTEEAMRWAPINSMSVVQYVGAQKGLLTRKQLEDYLAKAPADYKPEKI